MIAENIAVQCFKGIERTERSKASESAALQQASRRDERPIPAASTIISYDSNFDLKANLLRRL
jgi:hypothetical protein